MTLSDEAASKPSPEVRAVVEETCRYIDEFGESIHQDLMAVLEQIKSRGDEFEALRSKIAAQHAETRALIKSLMDGSAGAEDPDPGLRLS